MRFLFVILQCFCFAGFAQQSTDTLFFSKDWKMTSRDGAAFFRVYEKKGDHYLIWDKFISGKIQMTGSSKTIEPLEENGTFVFYNEAGYRTRVCNYEDGKLFGKSVWYFDSEKDSSVANYGKNGEVTMLYKGKNEVNADVYSIVEVMPEFPGGMPSLIKYIQTNINYPYDLKNKYIGGIVYVKFVVDTTGKITMVNLGKSSGFGPLDQEAMRITLLMPAWRPGTQNNRKVKVLFNLPINFSMSEPFFVYNTSNQDENYKRSIAKIEEADYSNAIDLMEACVKANKDDVDALYNLAVANYVKKRKKDSCKYFETVIEKSDDKSRVFANSKRFLEKYCN